MGAAHPSIEVSGKVRGVITAVGASLNTTAFYVEAMIKRDDDLLATREQATAKHGRPSKR
jgi:hypothetical protein